MRDLTRFPLALRTAAKRLYETNETIRTRRLPTGERVEITGYASQVLRQLEHELGVAFYRWLTEPQESEHELSVLRWGDEVAICKDDRLIFEIAPEVDPDEAEALARALLLAPLPEPEPQDDPV